MQPAQLQKRYIWHKKHRLIGTQSLSYFLRDEKISPNYFLSVCRVSVALVKDAQNFATISMRNYFLKVWLVALYHSFNISLYTHSYQNSYKLHSPRSSPVFSLSSLGCRRRAETWTQGLSYKWSVLPSDLLVLSFLSYIRRTLSESSVH